VARGAPPDGSRARAPGETRVGNALTTQTVWLTKNHRS
jgi:hypothetical protein